jgi:hypothetical protein
MLEQAGYVPPHLPVMKRKLQKPEDKQPLAEIWNTSVYRSDVDMVLWGGGIQMLLVSVVYNIK